MREPKHILALIQPGTNSRDIFVDALAGFERAGHRVTRFELGSIWQATSRLESDQPKLQALKSDLTQFLIEMVKSNRIDLAIGMWANVPLTFVNTVHHGRMGTVFELLGVPLVWWWLDAPHWAHNGGMIRHLGTDLVRGSFSHHVINNSATAREMRECFGMSKVHAIPYAVDPDVFSGQEFSEPDHDVVMCLGPGDPEPTESILQRVESREFDSQAIRCELAAELEGQLQHGFTGELNVKSLIIELLRSQVEHRHVPILNRAEGLAAGDTKLQQALQVLIGNPQAYIKVTEMVRSVERYERGIHAAALARRFRFAAFGPGVKEWAARWRIAARVTDLGSIEKHAQGDAYRRGRVAVNVMRWQDDVGINIKPFEITASGVTCVCTKRVGLAECFDIGKEVWEADSFNGVEACVSELIGNRSLCQTVAAAGCARTKKDHTWHRRSQSWIDAVFNKE